MKYLFLLILSINSGVLLAQAQFTPAKRPVILPGGDTAEGSYSGSGGSGGASPDGMARASGVVRARLLPTYMGQPLSGQASAGSSSAGVAESGDDQEAEVVDPRVARTAFLLDSISALVIRDSLVLVTDRISYLQATVAAQAKQNRQQSIQDYLSEVPSILPVRIRSWADYRVSSGFGLRWHPIRDMILNHSGIDFPQPLYTPVYATADGIVDRLVYQPAGLGLAVYLRHASGYTSIYGHLADHVLYLGDMVARGQPIGRVGMSGLTTGPHLHYSILDGDRPVDPLNFCFLLVQSLATPGVTQPADVGYKPNQARFKGHPSSFPATTNVLPDARKDKGAEGSLKLPVSKRAPVNAGGVAPLSLLPAQPRRTDTIRWGLGGVERVMGPGVPALSSGVRSRN